MTDTEYNRKLDELDRLLNDPAVPMQPSRIWALMDEIADRGGMSAMGEPARGAPTVATRGAGWFG